MTDSHEEHGAMGAAYAAHQLAKAQRAAESHADPAVRARAAAKVIKWTAVLRAQFVGALQVGRRQPLADVPVWATLEVVTGGFATGRLLAGGPIQPHETVLCERFGLEDRAALNAYFVSSEGLAELCLWLETGDYDVGVPEEGALLVVAWLVANGRVAEAQPLLDAIAPWMHTLRFFPIPRPGRGRATSTCVQLRSNAEVAAVLDATRPQPDVVAERESLTVWAAFYDRALDLLRSTVEGEVPTVTLDANGTPRRDSAGRYEVHGGWPLQRIDDTFLSAARTLVAEHRLARTRHTLVRGLHAPGSAHATLFALLERAVRDLRALSGREVGRLRLILARSVTVRGLPSSEARRAHRAAQASCLAPLHADLAKQVAARLRDLKEARLDAAALESLGDDLEVDAVRVPAPAGIRRKLMRAWFAPLETLVDEGVVTSANTFAQLLPQITSDVVAGGLEDPSLRTLYGRLYQAFRRRRSLLLTDLEHQVRLEELPWAAAVEAHRTDGDHAAPRRALRELSHLAMTKFPHAIVPNELVGELSALAKRSGLALPLVEEVAADIFMGTFSPKFLEAAKQAGALLSGTLYARYYDIDYRALGARKAAGKKAWFSFGRRAGGDAFAALCTQRAALPKSRGLWRSVAENGMILEQQQILTSQNLAVLTAGLGLEDEIAAHAPELAMACFEYAVTLLSVETNDGHAVRLHRKNAAYSWRQMLFFLSLGERAHGHPMQRRFVDEADAMLNEQASGAFVARFSPALKDLRRCIETKHPARRPFLGWSAGPHWLDRS